MQLACACNAGEVKSGTAPAKLTPPSSKGYLKFKEAIHQDVVTHASELANVQVVWLVKKNGLNEVTPVGVGMVVVKQMIVSAGDNTIS